MIKLTTIATIFAFFGARCTLAQTDATNVAVRVTFGPGVDYQQGFAPFIRDDVGDKASWAFEEADLGKTTGKFFFLPKKKNDEGNFVDLYNATCYAQGLKLSYDTPTFNFIDHEPWLEGKRSDKGKVWCPKDEAHAKDGWKEGDAFPDISSESLPAE
ncbi:hypothetical protein I204_02957 [Kwoniella mangroviensis CBS 8886]|nr:hypothetical protein I204_02957 [Kwoniella mangroviensis CBS 8886]